MTIILPNNILKFNEMLQQLNDAFATVIPKLNHNKTKVMSEESTTISIQNHNVENAEHSVYLGQDIRLGNPNPHSEM